MRPQQQIVPSGGDFDGYYITPRGEPYKGRKRSMFDRKVSERVYQKQSYRNGDGRRRGYMWRGDAQEQQQPMYGNSYAQGDDGYGDEYYGTNNGVDNDYGDAYDNENYDESFDDEYQQQQQFNGKQQQQMGQQVQPQMPAHHAMFAKMSPEELARSANVKFRKVTFEASRQIKPSQFLDRESKKLKNRGELILSVANKHLEPINASHKQDVFGVHNSKAKQDLVRRIDVAILSDYKGKLLLSIPTIGAIGTELFRNGANHFNYTIPAGALSLDKPYILSFERDITNGVVAFTNIFDSASPDTMEDKICHVSGRDYSLVPFKNIVINYWNLEHMNDGLAITEATLDPQLGGDVRMKTADVKRLLNVARESVTTKISLGNVTTDPMIVISAVEPTESKQMSLRAKEGGEGAERAYQFMGLADATCYLGKHASEAKKEKFMDTPFTFDLTASFEYLKVDGSTPIEFNK